LVLAEGNFVGCFVEGENFAVSKKPQSVFHQLECKFYLFTKNVFILENVAESFAGFVQLFSAKWFRRLKVFEMMHDNVGATVLHPEDRTQRKRVVSK